MEPHDGTDNKVSACLYINSVVLETAKKIGLNISKVSENALRDAIGKLSGLEPETELRNHAISGLPLIGKGRKRKQTGRFA